MSNKQNDIIDEAFYESLEEQRNMEEKAQRRNSYKTPFEFTEEADNFVFNQIKNA